MQKIAGFVLVLGMLAFTVACGGAHMPLQATESGLVAEGSGDLAAMSLADTGPTYENGVRAVFEKRCKLCHADGSPFGNWMDYESARSKAVKIKEFVFVKRVMPKAGSMEDSERKLLADWADAGAPKGAKAAVPVVAGAQVASCAPEVSTPSEAPEATSSEATPTASVEVVTSEGFKTGIRPLFEEKCAMCHNADSGLGNWLDETAARQKAERIRQLVFVEKKMPMFGEMSDEQRKQVADWADEVLK